MKAILTDVTKCIGCEQCVAACSVEHHLPPITHARWERGDGLSAERYTAVVRRGQAHVRKQCRHCLEPACASACPVGALHRTPEGPVVYDKDKCLGCRYCMMACPFGIPRYDWGAAVPYVRKCTMCYENRIKQGRQPACTEACPTKATIFGERDALLAEAHRRLRETPKLYQPRVWGETEVGGTSVIYLSPVSLDFLSLGRAQSSRPLPALTKTAMHAVPPVFVAMGAVMGSLYWIIERRNRLAGGETPSHHADAAPPPAGDADATPRDGDAPEGGAPASEEKHR
jgi:formate dehydrogenase iron-sulfur subunit